MPRPPCRSAGLILLAAFACAALPAAAGGEPPAGLVRLEREVGLRVAHVRDEGPVGSEQRRRLQAAASSDAQGEAALKAGDYQKARSCFLAAKEILDRLGI